MSRRVLPTPGHAADDASALIDQHPVRLPQLKGKTISHPAVPNSIMDLVLIALASCEGEISISQIGQVIDIW